MHVCQSVKQRIPPQEVCRWVYIHWFPLMPSPRFSRWGVRWRPDLSSSLLSSKQYQTWREQAHLYISTCSWRTCLYSPLLRTVFAFHWLWLWLEELRPQTRAWGMRQWYLHVSLLLWGDVDIPAVDELQILRKRLSWVMYLVLKWEFWAFLDTCWSGMWS